LIKAEYGSWVWHGFKLLARMKGLRGGRFDPFGYTAERRMERQLIVDYHATMLSLLATLDTGNLAAAVAIAGLPEKVRGFGHVKAKAIAEFHSETARLLESYAARPKDAIEQAA